MKRAIYEQLLKWKASKGHKPLILEGARQVGKTYIINEFGKKEYSKYAYFNFDSDSSLSLIFKDNLDIDMILLALSASIGFKIDSETLVFFDEIQTCDRAITSLKYFCEEKNDIDVIAAGSLLGLYYSEGTGFPAGKVDFLKMYPMSFKEFLVANKEELIVDLIIKKDYDTIKLLKDKIEHYFKIYCFVGGMPEVVKRYIETYDFNEVTRLQKGILRSYDLDFSKHAKNGKLEKIRMVWNAIPMELSKNNKKFKYGDLKKGARAKDFEDAIEFLKDAGLIYVINNIKKWNLLIKTYEDTNIFKIYALDVGLLSNMNSVPANIINDMDKIFAEYKGSLAEQFVLSQIFANGIENVFYYNDATSRNEIDFVIEESRNIVPIEVKAGINLKAKSLANVIEKYNLKKAIRYSLADHKVNDIIEDIPLYCI